MWLVAVDYRRGGSRAHLFIEWDGESYPPYSHSCSPLLPTSFLS